MPQEHASTKQIVTTLVGLGVGLLALLAIIVAMSTALAPKTPPDTVPPMPDVTATATPSETVAAPAPAPTPAPAQPATPSAQPSATAAATNTPSATRPLAGRIIVVDAGHQLHADPALEPIGPGSKKKRPKVEAGTSGVKSGKPESLINLQVAMKLKTELERRGASVVMVRTTQDVDISNSKRAEIANRAVANLFVRLHCDGSTDRAKHGISTLVPGLNDWSRPILSRSGRAGQAVQRAVVAQTGAKDLGVVPRTDLAGFNWSVVPAVLVEMGFMTNPDEDAKLNTAAYQDQLAVGIANGIQEYATQ